MSLSAALSIFAPPSGLAPNGGEGVSGDEGLFAGLVEAETATAHPKVSARATVGRVPSDEAVNDDAPVVATLTADGVLAPPTLPVAPPPEVRPTGSTKIDGVAQTVTTQATPPEPEGAVTSNDDRILVAGSSFAASSPSPQPTAPAKIAKTETVPEPAKASKAETVQGSVVALDPAVEADSSKQIDAAKQAVAASLPAVDRSGQTTARSAVDTRVAARPRDIAATRAPVLDTGTAEIKAEDTASAGTVDPAIVKAVRGPNAPVPVAPPPVAPALATALQSGGNAPVASTDTSAPEGSPPPTPDRIPGAAVFAAPASVVPSPDLAPAQAESAPLLVAEPPADPDTVVTEGRVETLSEAAPAAPAAVNASNLSRASIETTALLAAQIARRLEGRSTRFDMALTPEGLGRVDVRVEIDRDGQLAARLAFDNPAAATELRARADELRRQLEDAGFTLWGDALEFSDRDSSSGGQGAFERQQRRAAYAHRVSPEPDLAAGPVAWSPRSTASRGVDVKV